MKLWTCTNAVGHYPVGTAAIVVASCEEQARDELIEAFALAGLPQDRSKLQLERVKLGAPRAIILRDGNY